MIFNLRTSRVCSPPPPPITGAPPPRRGRKMERYREYIDYLFTIYLNTGNPASRLLTMTIFMAGSLSALMIFTALLSGIFGMAGGLILIGVLLTLFPVPQAMVLHAVTQMASNGW